MKAWRWIPLLSLSLGFLGAGRVAAQAGVVARAAGMELGVEEAARLLAASPEAAAEPEVVAGLAELWVDYALLAAAAAEDPGLARLDLERLGAPMRDEAAVAALLEREVRVDTVFSDAEVRAAWQRENPGLGEPPSDYREFLLWNRRMEASERYADSLTAAAAMRLEPGAADAYREIVRTGADGRGAAVLARYRGGELTADEVAAAVLTLPAEQRGDLGQEPAGRLEDDLRHLAAREVLLLQARALGVTPAPAVADSLRTRLRRALAETLAQAGLAGKGFPPAGAARDAALRAHTGALLRRMAADGGEPLLPLGMLGALLRDGGRGQLFPAAFPAVAARARAIRAGR